MIISIVDCLIKKSVILQGPVLLLNDGQAGTGEPVNIPLPNLISPRSLDFDAKESIRSSGFLKFLKSQPLPIREQFLTTRQKREVVEQDTIVESETTQESLENVDCSWRIKVCTEMLGNLNLYCSDCSRVKHFVYFRKTI